jgi:putative membrane protein
MWMNSSYAWRWRAALFACGAAVLICAIWLDQLSTVLISAHMTQHLLLTIVAPLLFVAARPWRIARRSDVLSRIGKMACHPVFAWLVFCGPFIFWHLPDPYVWMVGSASLRAAALFSFFAGAMVFWTTVFGLARPQRVAYGTAILLVLSAAMATSLPGALMSFAPQLLYRGLADPFPICGLTGLQDQQLAGLIMWIPMDAVLFAVAAWLFVAWLREAERRSSLRTAAAASSGLLLMLLLAGCADGVPQAAAENLGGNPRHGAALINQYGCGACHTIPGIAGAGGLVGPPLTGIAQRVYLAGVLRNSPENMSAWLQDPQQFVPGNAMPRMGISPSDARDLTAFLYTLR